MVNPRSLSSSRSRSRSRSRQTPRDLLPSPSASHSPRRRYSPASSRRRSASRDSHGSSRSTGHSRHEGEGVGEKKPQSEKKPKFLKSNAALIAGMGVAAVAAYKLWPQGPQFDEDGPKKTAQDKVKGLKNEVVNHVQDRIWGEDREFRGSSRPKEHAEDTMNGLQDHFKNRLYGESREFAKQPRGKQRWEMDDDERGEAYGDSGDYDRYQDGGYRDDEGDAMNAPPRRSRGGTGRRRDDDYYYNDYDYDDERDYAYDYDYDDYYRDYDSISDYDRTTQAFDAQRPRSKSVTSSRPPPSWNQDSDSETLYGLPRNRRAPSTSTQARQDASHHADRIPRHPQRSSPSRYGGGSAYDDDSSSTAAQTSSVAGRPSSLTPEDSYELAATKRRPEPGREDKRRTVKEEVVYHVPPRRDESSSRRRWEDREPIADFAKWHNREPIAELGRTKAREKSGRHHQHRHSTTKRSSSAEATSSGVPAPAETRRNAMKRLEQVEQRTKNGFPFAVPVDSGGQGSRHGGGRGRAPDMVYIVEGGR